MHPCQVVRKRVGQILHDLWLLGLLAGLRLPSVIRSRLVFCRPRLAGRRLGIHELLWMALSEGIAQAGQSLRWETLEGVWPDLLAILHA